MMDMEMEVLCCLPPSDDPRIHGAYLDEIADDIGVSIATVACHVAKLREQGITIRSTNVPSEHRRCYSIGRCSWNYAQALGDEYFKVAYGDRKESSHGV